MNKRSNITGMPAWLDGSLHRMGRRVTYAIVLGTTLSLAGPIAGTVFAAGPTGPLSLTDGFRIVSYQARKSKPKAAETAIVRIAKRPLDRTGRFWGAGFGDGYHACHGSGLRPGADLPPVSSHASRRNLQTFSASGCVTYYDQFDNQSWTQTCDCESGGCESGGCVGTHWQSVQPMASVDPTVTANDDMVAGPSNDAFGQVLAIDAPIEGWDELITPSPKQLTAPGKMSGSLTSVPTRLPPVPAPATTMQPTRLPAPRRDHEAGRTADREATQRPDRVAEIPDWFKKSAESIQANPFVR